jgi:regulator of nucleoside diphosphate kinase
MPDHENRAAAPFSDRLSDGLARLLSPGSEPPSFAHSPSCVTAPDRARLRAMLAAEGHNANRIVRRALTQKLWHATVCAPDAVPADLVTMHSRVVYRRHIGEPLEERRLCFSDENASAGSVLPILTPLGTAMLGLRAGSSAPYEIAGGIRLMLVVERVAYQPEAARVRLYPRFSLPPPPRCPLSRLAFVASTRWNGRCAGRRRSLRNRRRRDPVSAGTRKDAADRCRSRRRSRTAGRVNCPPGEGVAELRRRVRRDRSHRFLR